MRTEDLIKTLVVDLAVSKLRFQQNSRWRHSIGLDHCHSGVEFH